MIFKKLRTIYANIINTHRQQLSSLFLVNNIPKDKMEKSIHATDKLLEWVDSFRAGDADYDDDETWEDNVVLSDSAFKYEFGGLERFYPQKPFSMETLQEEADKLQPRQTEKVSICPILTIKACTTRSTKGGREETYKHLNNVVGNQL